jgi:hypothetical protein
MRRTRPLPALLLPLSRRWKKFQDLCLIRKWLGPTINTVERLHTIERHHALTQTSATSFRLCEKVCMVCEVVLSRGQETKGVLEALS